MTNQIILLSEAVLLTASFNVILQLLVARKKMKKIEKEWHTIKSLLSLLSFKKYLDVVSAEKAQELLEELIVGLRTYPSISVVSSEVENKLSSLKGGLKALLDALNLADELNFNYIKAKNGLEIALFTSASAIFLLPLITIPSISYLALGMSLGLVINSVYFLVNSLYNLEKIERTKKHLKTLID